MLRFATHWAPPHGWRPLQLYWYACIEAAPRLLRDSCALPGFDGASKLSSLREEPREEGVQRVGRKPKRELAFGRF